MTNVWLVRALLANTHLTVRVKGTQSTWFEYLGHHPAALAIQHDGHYYCSCAVHLYCCISVTQETYCCATGHYHRQLCHCYLLHQHPLDDVREFSFSIVHQQVPNP